MYIGKWKVYGEAELHTHSCDTLTPLTYISYVKFRIIYHRAKVNSHLIHNRRNYTVGCGVARIQPCGRTLYVGSGFNPWHHIHACTKRTKRGREGEGENTGIERLLSDLSSI